MKICPYCKEQVPDDAVRCRYCSSWLDSADDIHSPIAERVVYVVDRGLLRFAKFSLSILAIFLLIGAFFYGIDLKQSAKEIRQVKEEVQEAKEQAMQIRAALVSERSEIEKLEQELSKSADKAKAFYDEILRHRDQAEILMATLQTPLDESRVRILFKEFAVEHLSPVLTASQIAKIQETFRPTSSGLSQMVEQPSLSLIRVRQAISEIEPSRPIIVAILSDRSTSALPELNERFVKAKSFVVEDRASYYFADHTTAVASIVAAIAPSTKIMPVAVLGRSGAGFPDQIMKGVKYAIENGARVIVMPFGSSHSETFERLFQQFADNDTLFIASAGIGASEAKTFPAALPGVLAIATTDESDKKADFSSYGSWVDLSAPGVNIQALNDEGNLIRLSGGSFSTAVAGGVAALVFSVRPDLSGAEVTDILKRSAVNLQTKNPTFGDLLGSGRIDALEAVSIAKGLSS